MIRRASDDRPSPGVWERFRIVGATRRADELLLELEHPLGPAARLFPSGTRTYGYAIDARGRAAYIQQEDALEEFLKRMRDYFAYLSDHYDISAVGLSDLADLRKQEIPSAG